MIPFLLDPSSTTTPMQAHGMAVIMQDRSNWVLAIFALSEVIAFIFEVTGQHRFAKAFELLGLLFFVLLAVADHQATKCEGRAMELEQPRHLSDTDKHSLAKCLAPAAGQMMFLARALDHEGRSYGKDFEDVFETAHWKLNLLEGLDPPDEEWLVKVDHREPLDGPARQNARALQRCMQELKLDARLADTDPDDNSAMQGMVLLEMPWHP